MLIISTVCFLFFFYVLKKVTAIFSLSSLSCHKMNLDKAHFKSKQHFQRKRLPTNNRNIVVIGIAYALIFLAASLFFKDLLMASMIGLVSFLVPPYMQQMTKLKNKTLLALQFKDAIAILKNALIAGLSIRQAIIYTSVEVKKLHSHDQAPIVLAFTRMHESLEMGVALTAVLQTFKSESNLEEVDDFVDITIMTHIRGGNLIEVVGNLEQMITTKIQVKQDIGTLTASKVFESKILTLMPFVMVILLTLMSPEYMQPLYNTAFGKVLMVFGVVLITINYHIGKRIVRIDV